MRKLGKDLSDRPYWVELWGSDEVLMWLEKEEGRGNWSPIEKASLVLIRGLKYVSIGSYKEALPPLLGAVAIFSQGNIPQQDHFGEALFDVGYNLHEEGDGISDVIGAYKGVLKAQICRSKLPQ